MSDDAKELEMARARLDQLDMDLLSLLATRFQIIREVAEIKKRHDIPVMQSERVRTVLETRSAAASKAGLNKAFVSRIWKELVSEACRVENQLLGAPNGEMEFQGVRIDHVAIAVKSLDSAVHSLQTKLGFEVIDQWSIDGEFSGMDAVVMKAGDVTFVVVQGTNPASNVSKYIDAYGPGVQHIAIEVDDIAAVRGQLIGRGLNMIGDIYEVGGVRQAFSDRDQTTGLQIEIVSRSSDSVFEPANVADLFRAMEAENVF